MDLLFLAMTILFIIIFNLHVVLFDLAVVLVFPDRDIDTRQATLLRQQVRANLQPKSPYQVFPALFLTVLHDAGYVLPELHPMQEHDTKRHGVELHVGRAVE